MLRLPRTLDFLHRSILDHESPSPFPPFTSCISQSDQIWIRHWLVKICCRVLRSLLNCPRKHVFIKQSTDGSVILPQQKWRSQNESRNQSVKEWSAVTDLIAMQWSPELHQRFVIAVEQLGGAMDAKPTAILQAMERMDVHGLTLRKVKSHLQIYRNKVRDEAEEISQCANDDTEESPNSEALSFAVVSTPRIGAPGVHAVESSRMDICKRMQEEMEEAGDYMQLLGGAQDKSLETFEEDPYDAAIRELFDS